MMTAIVLLFLGPPLAEVPCGAEFQRYSDVYAEGVLPPPVAKKIADAKAEMDACYQREHERIAQILDTKQGRRMAFSAALCSALETRAEVLGKIKTEKKYAGQTGVVRVGTLSDLRGELEIADAKVASAREHLASEKSKPIGCKDKIIASVADCISGYSDVLCEAPWIRVLVGMAE